MSTRFGCPKYDQSVRPAFSTALRDAVDDYFARTGRTRKATPFMWFKLVVLIGAGVGLWWALASQPHSLVVTLLLLIALAFAKIFIAFNVAHDAVHEALSARRWVNESIYYLCFQMLGPSAYLWRHRHKAMHHYSVNIPGADFNIEAAGILRFAPTQTWRPMHRYQHLYAPFAYMLFTAHWIFIKDFKMFFMPRLGSLPCPARPGYRLAEMLLWKLMYVGYMILLPIHLLPYTPGQVLLGFFFYQAVVSFFLVITFVGSHLNEGIIFVETGDDRRVPHSFLEHQLRTSVDFHPENPVVSFFYGGFNAHVAHHCFPQVCSVHYPAITRIIRRLATEHGLPYLERPIWALYRDHFRFLRHMGQAPRGPAEAYLWRPIASPPATGAG